MLETTRETVQQDLFKKIKRPPNLLKVDWRPLFDNRVRVNVWVETEKGPLISYSELVVNKVS